MAAHAHRDTPMRYDSSAGELSSPPSGSLSEPGSPSRRGAGADPAAGHHQQLRPEMHQSPAQEHAQRPQEGQPTPPPQPTMTATSRGSGPQKRYALVEGQWVQLTAAGVPRKKPGRKPGTVMKPKNGEEAPKTRRPRKPPPPPDPNAPPPPRKRKIAPAGEDEAAMMASRSLAAAPPSGVIGTHALQPSMAPLAPSPPPSQLPQYQSRYSPKMPKRESYPGSMHNILNSDGPPAQQHNNAVPMRTSGQSYDPIRGNYDPVRETMSSHNPYSSTGSPRAPTNMSHRSPSIASLIEPQAPAMISPSHSHHGYPPAPAQPRYQTQESTSVPPSPSHTPALVSTPTPASRLLAQESKKDPPPPPPPVQRAIVKESNFTTISNGPIRKPSPKQKPVTGVSTPRTDNLDDMPQDSEGRSILDFGRVNPGEESQAPTIELDIPIQAGETNKYVNFMRLAEDRYGWDALHPRLAANRDRKARIAAAAASLEKVESGRESGDEMSVDLSDAEGSNPENGGTSGPDAQTKKKKKRNFKEDQYDVDDDFVDDSELLWEAQAAASRDGFFVYSGPLVPEAEKPAAGHDGPPKRGRGGRGSRGGRGGSTRGAGTGRGGGPGSRGGQITRKPRITKSEKAQREREKAERESMAQMTKTPTNGYVVQPTTPSFAVSELGA